MMRSLSTKAFGQPSETKLTLGARAVSRMECRSSMAEGLPERAGGGKPSGPNALLADRRHRIFMIAAYIESRSRPSCRPRMYGRERGAIDVGPPGEIPGGFSILEVGSSADRLARAGQRPPVSRPWPGKMGPSRYLHTAANEPRRHVARLSSDGVACG